jgi:hypothetical protein
MHHSISLIVNGVRRDIALADARVTLLDLSRERLHLTETKAGCHRGPMRRLHHFRRWPANQILPRFGGESRCREITTIEGAARCVLALAATNLKGTVDK